MKNNGCCRGQTATFDAARFARDSGAHVLILTPTGPSLCTAGSRGSAIGEIAIIFENGKITRASAITAARCFNVQRGGIGPAEKQPKTKTRDQSASASGEMAHIAILS